MTELRGRPYVLRTLAVLTAAAFLIAPNSNKPEKIKCGPIKWNAEERALEVHMMISAGIAERAERYSVATQLTIRDREKNVLATFSAHDPVIGAHGHSQGLVRVKPQSFLWPHTLRLEGPVQIVGHTDLEDAEGGIVDSADTSFGEAPFRPRPASPEALSPSRGWPAPVSSSPFGRCRDVSALGSKAA